MKINELADGFGLTIEAVERTDYKYRVLKGLNEIFAGTEAEVETFLAGYKDEVPDLMQMSMYGYKE